MFENCVANAITTTSVSSGNVKNKFAAAHNSLLKAHTALEKSLQLIFTLDARRRGKEIFHVLTKRAFFVTRVVVLQYRR